MTLWQAALLSVGLLVVLVLCLCGAAYVWWRMAMDSKLGHAWAEDWKEFVKRWRWSR